MKKQSPSKTMKIQSHNEFSYLGNSLVKCDGVQHNYTKDEIEEYVRCSTDVAYFAKKYMKVIHIDKGLVPFDLYSYQENMLRHFDANRFSIVLACRQSGKSITSVAYILHTALFKTDQTIVILANKAAIAKEMLGRVTLALENIPFFLQPGCKALNKLSIEFSNNSRIIAAATSSSSIRGMSASLLFCDEFAFVNKASEFYTSTYPVISSGKTSKVIITSTPNGIGNMFYKLWEGAVQGTNEFKPFRVDWWDVPGRDENWKKMTVANTSELQFRQEFENKFDGTSSTLVEANSLLTLKAKDPIKVMYSNTLKIYEDPLKGHYYVMTVDVSQGRGKDYSSFSVFDVTQKPFRQVAVYNNNAISPLLFPDIIVKTAQAYNDAVTIIENNNVGQIVCNAIYYDHEYENLFVESTVKAGGIGVTTTKKTKRLGVSTLKDLIEQSKLEINDAETIAQLSMFEESGSSYEAKQGYHDDLVMTLVLFSWFISTSAFGEYSEIDVKKMLYESRQKEIEDEMLDVGFISSLTKRDTGLRPEYHKLKNELDDWSRI